MKKTAVFWIRDGVLVDRMHVNPVAFAVASLAYADPDGIGRTTMTALVNFGFATSGISCADKMHRFNRERFPLIPDVQAAAAYYNVLATEAAGHCQYFNGACQLVKTLQEAGVLNFITSAVEQSVLDTWASSASAQELVPHLTEVLGKRSGCEKGEQHFRYVREQYGVERIFYVADAVAEIADGAQFAKLLNISPIGFAHVITPAKVRLANKLVMAAHAKLFTERASTQGMVLNECELNLPGEGALVDMLREAQAIDVVGGTASDIFKNLTAYFNRLLSLPSEKNNARNNPMNKRYYVQVATKADLADTSVRFGETKMGQEIKLLSTADTAKFEQSLADSMKAGARYAIIGVAEDIGARANLGRPGADRAWTAFLKFFLNMQANQYLDASKVVLIGQVDLDDIKARAASQQAGDGQVSIACLRELCAEIDDRVHPVVRSIVQAGLEPIVIGGCNNISYPTIKGVVTALREQSKNPGLTLATVNCDPHADFRIIEGRHSGNPFTYADKDGLLGGYCVLGAHENYNSLDMIERLGNRDFPLFFWDDVVRGERTWEEQVQRAIDYLSTAKTAAIKGVELDLDGIKNLPSSAKTPFGITPEQAYFYIYRLASTLDTKYLLLSEAAPSYGDDGERTVGKVLAKTVVEYVRAREQYRSVKSILTYATVSMIETGAAQVTHR